MILRIAALKVHLVRQTSFQPHFHDINYPDKTGWAKRQNISCFTYSNQFDPKFRIPDFEKLQFADFISITCAQGNVIV